MGIASKVPPQVNPKLPIKNQRRHPIEDQNDVPIAPRKCKYILYLITVLHYNNCITLTYFYNKIFIKIVIPLQVRRTGRITGQRPQHGGCAKINWLIFYCNRRRSYLKRSYSNKITLMLSYPAQLITKI